MERLQRWMCAGPWDELKDVVGNPVFVEQMKDVIDYRTMDYYQRRYRDENGIV